jgi:hypothetical protein
MSLIATAVKHMMAAGMDADAICAAVADMEASIDTRSTAAQRQARYRERNKASQSVTQRNDVTINPSPLIPPLKAPPDPLKITPPISPHPVVEDARDPLEILFDVVSVIAGDVGKRLPAPVGVSRDQWKAFRKQRKKPLTDRAYLMICKKLSALAEDGWPPGEMIDLAIERGWETVFEPKEQGNGKSTYRGGPAPDPTLALLRAAMQAQRQDGGDYHETRPEISSGQFG